MWTPCDVNRADLSFTQQTLNCAVANTMQIWENPENGKADSSTGRGHLLFLDIKPQNVLNL